jgi:hypothetical protein
MVWLPLYVSRGTVVATATAYGLDDRGVGVRVPVKSRTFTSPYRPDRLWGSTALVFNKYRGLFPGDKTARAWSWPLTSNWYQGQENVGLYIHSPIRLHGVVLSELSTGTTLRFFTYGVILCCFENLQFLFNCWLPLFRLCCDLATAKSGFIVLRFKDMNFLFNFCYSL